MPAAAVAPARVAQQPREEARAGLAVTARAGSRAAAELVLEVAVGRVEAGPEVAVGRVEAEPEVAVGRAEAELEVAVGRAEAEYPTVVAAFA